MEKYHRNVCFEPTDKVFQKYLNDGIITLDDVMNSNKEDIMEKILKRVHHSAITETKDGRYATFVPDETKPHGRRQVRKKSKEELYRFLIGFYGFQGDVKKGHMSFGKLFEEWISYKRRFVGVRNRRRALSPSTIRRYERDFAAYINGTTLCDMKICRITTPSLMIMLTDIIKTNDMTERCAGNMLGYIRQSFEYAYRSEYISKDPYAVIDRNILLSMCRYVPPKRDEERVLTKSGLAALFEKTIEHEKKYPDYMPNYGVELAIHTGMRVGEIAALHWEDVNDKVIHVDYSEHRLDYIDKKSEIVIDEPKNCKHRAIPQTEETRDLFRRIKERNHLNEEGFVFADKDGKRCTAHTITCAAYRRGEEAGLGKTSIHEIRRTISSMLNEVLPQTVVASILGHTPEVNETHYNYSTAEYNEKVRALNEVSTIVNKDFDKKNARKAP